MAITPNEAVRASNVENESRRGATEEMVDRMLRRGGRTLATDLVHRDDERWLIATYEHAGWNVERVPDSRDGDFYRFEAKGSAP